MKFWEGHKILRNLHQLFDWQYIGQIIGVFLAFTHMHIILIMHCELHFEEFSDFWHKYPTFFKAMMEKTAKNYEIWKKILLPLVQIKVTQRSALLLDAQFEAGKKSLSLLGIPFGKLEWMWALVKTL